MIKKILVVSLLVFTLLFLASCSKEDFKKEVDRLKGELKKIQGEFEEYKAKAEELGGKALEEAKEQLDKLKVELEETKDKLAEKTKELQEHIKGKDEDEKENDVDEKPNPEPQPSPTEPVSIEDAQKVIEPYGLHIEVKNNSEFDGIIAKREGQGDFYFVYYALAKTDMKADELFLERLLEESQLEKVVDDNAKKYYSASKEGMYVVLALTDKTFLYVKGQKEEEVVKIVKGLGMKLDE